MDSITRPRRHELMDDEYITKLKKEGLNRGALKNNLKVNLTGITNYNKGLKPCEHKFKKYWRRFEGWWQLDSCDDWDTITLIQFYLKDGHPVAKFFDGTQDFPRELALSDDFRQIPSISRPDSLDECPIQLIGRHSLRFLNSDPILSSDQLHSTFKIQDDNDVAYMILWSDWDGGADSSKYGFLETLTRYRRLAGAPVNLQYNNQSTLVDWNNLVNQFRYIDSAFYNLGQPQKASSLNQTHYIGREKALEFFQTMITTGVKRVYQSTKTIRPYASNVPGVTGNKIGVWKTRNPAFPWTTIHTDGSHKLNLGSRVVVSGLKGAWSAFNGTHNIIIGYPGARQNEFAWGDPTSYEYQVNLNFDSSNIEEYDYNLHGIATVTAQHGPITPTTGYRDFVAAVYDYMVTVYGPGTHFRLATFVKPVGYPLLPDTFQELQELLNNEAYALNVLITRSQMGNLFGNLYWLPGFNVNNFRINDPFGLYRYNPGTDIDLDNYLVRDETYNMFFRITGPVLESEPITGQLTNYGYKNNGSEVDYTVAKLGETPDGDGWMLYASMNDDTSIRSRYGYFGAQVQPSKTNGKSEVVIRLLDETNFDSPGIQLFTRTLVFGDKRLHPLLSSYVIRSLAELIKKLKTKFNPDRWILDIRYNLGGLAQFAIAFAHLVGGNRKSPDNVSVGLVGENRDPINLENSGIKTAYDSVPNASKEFIDVDAVAAVLGEDCIIRSSEKPIEFVVLTSTRAGSGGDMLPHMFIGSDPNKKIHDLGGNVTAWITGDIYGVLFSGIKLYHALACDQINPNLTWNGRAQSPVYLSMEAGLLVRDANGSYVNQQYWTQPQDLIPAWYDQREWADLGYTQPLSPWPIPGPSPQLLPDGTPDLSTARDRWLEHAIATNVTI